MSTKLSEVQERLLTALEVAGVDGLSYGELHNISGLLAHGEFRSNLDVLIEAGLASPAGYATGVSEGGDMFIHANAIMGVHATKKSAGLDVFAVEDVTIKPDESVKVVSSYTIPKWVRESESLLAYLAMPRSSYWEKFKLLLTNGVGLIDMDFPKPVLFSYHNFSKKAVTIKKGDKVGQLVLFNAIQHGVVANKEREDGFGSTDEVVAQTTDDVPAPPPPPPVA